MNLSDKKILQKVINGTSSRENAKYVVDWFSSTIEGHQTLSDMMDRDAYLMEEDLLNTKKISPIQSDIVFKNIQKKIRRDRITRVSIMAAAMIVPLILVIGFAFYTNSRVDLLGRTPYAEIYVPKGEKARILFQDGSEAYLNSDTKIRYPRKFGLTKRNVYLEGEAYFNVSHNKYRPFIVHTGNTHVKVLGTSFNVNAYVNDEKIYVVLDEGKIEFNTFTEHYAIYPGQQFIYNKRSGEYFVHHLSKSTNVSLWKENIVYLNDTPLFYVLQILERRYDVSFTVRDPDAFTYSYTLTTKQTSIDEILQELEKISPVRFLRQKDTIEVSVS